MRKRNRKQERKFCLGVLAAVMILAVWGIPVLAETACETVNAAEAVERTGEIGELPENPVHHCVKDDTTWSYVYFGSYPQTEVTGAALTEEITGASYDANGDAWVNGMKYRRISESDTNNNAYFGDSEYRYFKWERIKWRVLDINSDTMFVVADKGLDCKDYHDPGDSVTWETCTLRSWLNNDFYRTAFDSREQGAVVPQTAVNEDSKNGTEAGNNTTDKVFLLSLSEVINPDYGFCENDEAYSGSRRVKLSDYAHVRGAWVRTSTDYAGNCQWWLRSLGASTGSAAFVDNSGSVVRNGGGVYGDNDACVPALHINLYSDLWSMSDNGSSGGGGELPSNPVHYCMKEDSTAWNHVYFGSYPQMEVAGDDLTEAITGASYDANGDAWVNGRKYRRISKGDTAYDGYFGSSTYRYFKWERIQWRVLDVNNDTMFVVADKGLDCKNYNEEDTSVTWETCTLRSWLNKDFYGIAFDNREQGAIVPQTVINEDHPMYGTEGGNNTTDKMFLLSLSEVMNPDYGFCENDDAYSGSRRVKASDYAHARGAGVSTSTDYAGSSWWWLRSPGSSADSATSVVSDGSVSRYGLDVSGDIAACVPALHINLSSDLWYMSDDGTSGEGGDDSGRDPGNNGNSGISSGSSDSETTQATPKATNLKGKLKADKKSITVQWKKQTGVSGYQIQYSANKKFKKNAAKIKTVKKSAAIKVTIKKLKAGKKYYVRVRTYKTVNGRDYYSGWSKAKTVKTKE